MRASGETARGGEGFRRIPLDSDSSGNVSAEFREACTTVEERPFQGREKSERK